MAERRMFAKTIIDSDAFLDMPLSAQALYFHLSMRADDDGFLNNAKKIMRTIGANQNDYDILVLKSFIIQFEDGICVIKHWRINNYLRNDRYKHTIYSEQMDMLEVKDNGRYSLKNDVGIPLGIPDGYQLDTQYRLGKDSLDKDIKERNIKERKSTDFTPPTIEEIRAYCLERHNNVDPQQFFDYYNAGGWKDQGGKPVKNWKQKMIAVWEKNDNGRSTNTNSKFESNLIDYPLSDV